MTIAIKYDGETGEITNRYYKGDREGWTSTDESDWPDPSLADDEYAIYYYDPETGEISYQIETAEQQP